VVSAADTLPFLLASLPAGALVDRVRRRPVMIVCDLARAATLISIPVTWWLGALAIWQVVVVAFILGTFSAVMVGVPLMHNDYTLWLAAAAFTVAVAGSVAFNVTSVSFRQRLAPPRLLGRVNATMRFLVIGAMPLGGLLGGAFGTWFGVRPTLWIAAVGSMLAFLPAFFSPLRSMRTLPTFETPASAACQPANV